MKTVNKERATWLNSLTPIDKDRKLSTTNTVLYTRHSKKEGYGIITAITTKYIYISLYFLSSNCQLWECQDIEFLKNTGFAEDDDFDCIEPIDQKGLLKANSLYWLSFLNKDLASIFLLSVLEQTVESEFKNNSDTKRAIKSKLQEIKYLLE